MSSTKANLYFFTSLILAIWFALTSYIWTYLANLIISLPFGIISLLLWRKGKEMDSRPKRYKIIAVTLVIGIILSLITLVYFLVNE